MPGVVMVAAVKVAVACLLGGCSTIGSMNPINWWHQQQGGKIAEQRPAPPGAEQPYPNLASVPGKPTPPDQEALKKLTASLVADRTNAQHAAQAAPLPDPSSPNASPGLFGVGSAPPPPPPSGGPGGGQASTASASIPAVTAPPAPATPPPVVADTTPAPAASPPAAPARRTPVQTAPLTSPSAPPAASFSPSPVANNAPAAVASAEPAPAVANPPTLPAGPPPRPAAAGAPPQAAGEPQPMPVRDGKTAEIVFPDNTSTLSTAATDEVKAFAAGRGNAVINVTGHGEAEASDIAAQSAALNLGLARAQSISDALKSAGVPANAIRVGAEASGRGASLHLLQ